MLLLLFFFFLNQTYQAEKIIRPFWIIALYIKYSRCRSIIIFDWPLLLETLKWKCLYSERESSFFFNFLLLLFKLFLCCCSSLLFYLFPPLIVRRSSFHFSLSFFMTLLCCMDKKDDFWNPSAFCFEFFLDQNRLQKIFSVLAHQHY